MTTVFQFLIWHNIKHPIWCSEYTKKFICKLNKLTYNQAKYLADYAT